MQKSVVYNQKEKIKTLTVILYTIPADAPLSSNRKSSLGLSPSALENPFWSRDRIIRSQLRPGAHTQQRTSKLRQRRE